MAGLKVAIVGAGRLAALLAARIPAQVRKVIISRHRSDAVQIADEVGGIASDQFASVRGCSAVFLAVPGGEVEPVVRDLAAHLEGGALVVNMALDLDTDRLRSVFPDIRFSAAKLIGDAGEMLSGWPGVVLITVPDAGAEAHLRDLLEGLGVIVVEDESRAAAVARTVVAELMAAEARLRSRLGEQGLSGSLANAVIAALGPGVMRALAGGETSTWLEAVIAAERTGRAPLPAGEPLFQT